MSTSRMPRWYNPLWGTPLYWSDEQSGELAAAIAAYLNHMLTQAPFSEGPAPSSWTTCAITSMPPAGRDQTSHSFASRPVRWIPRRPSPPGLSAAWTADWTRYEAK